MVETAFDIYDSLAKVKDYKTFLLFLEELENSLIGADLSYGYAVESMHAFATDHNELSPILNTNKWRVIAEIVSAPLTYE